MSSRYLLIPSILGNKFYTEYKERPYSFLNFFVTHIHVINNLVNEPIQILYISTDNCRTTQLASHFGIYTIYWFFLNPKQEHIVSITNLLNNPVENQLSIKALQWDQTSLVSVFHGYSSRRNYSSLLDLEGKFKCLECKILSLVAVLRQWLLHF